MKLMSGRDIEEGSGTLSGWEDREILASAIEELKRRWARGRETMTDLPPIGVLEDCAKLLMEQRGWTGQRVTGGQTERPSPETNVENQKAA